MPIYFTLGNSTCTIDGSESKAVISTIGAETGVGYDVDLKLGQSESNILLIAEVGKFVENPTTNQAKIVGQYGHVKIKPSNVNTSFNLDYSIQMKSLFGSILDMSQPSYVSLIY